MHDCTPHFYMVKNKAGCASTHLLTIMISSPTAVILVLRTYERNSGIFVHELLVESRKKGREILFISFYVMFMNTEIKKMWLPCG